ncbi:hypothetical protein BDF19DRAFT_444412 [Syncephalis fuscata]|nr:hypothetical protein BDF19DRAFT_444412 [Syncephalis fuscata]
MRTLGNILQRLETESLTPPMTVAQLASGKHASGDPDSRIIRHRQSSKSLYGQIVEGDPDLVDPRWKNLFREYFVDYNDPDTDDLLFFVRKAVDQPDERDAMHDDRASLSSSRPSSVFTHRQTLEDNADPVFVKRRQTQPNPMPHLDNDIVLWKETFFLNLIVQVPVKLTVAVCKRNVEAASPTGRRSSMIQTTRRVSRSVYAMPTKSSVNEKERSWECSWPLIYYVVEDFEDAFEQLVVRDGEYLCVELSAMVPATTSHYNNSSSDNNNNNNNNNTRFDASGGTDAALSALNGRRVSQDGNSNYKVTLFQGAASFAALMDNYKRKTAPKINRRFRLTTGNDPPLTEFIMMRGPGGKGHAQVAITGYDVHGAENQQYSEHKEYASPEDYYPKRSESPFAPFVRPNSAASFFQSLKRIALNEHPEPVVYDSLQCCMTFVNVPWTSVVTDLMAVWKHASAKNSR